MSTHVEDQVQHPVLLPKYPADLRRHGPFVRLRDNRGTAVPRDAALAPRRLPSDVTVRI